MGYDSSLRVIYANGMDSHYQTEPHILAGAANPTVARRNMSLPGENGQNLVEWRFRKEQTRGKVIVFGRKLRVSTISLTNGSPLNPVADGMLTRDACTRAHAEKMNSMPRSHNYLM